MRTTQSQPILDVFAKVYGGYKQVMRHCKATEQLDNFLVETKKMN